MKFNLTHLAKQHLHKILKRIRVSSSGSLYCLIKSNGLRKSLRDAEISNYVSINPTTFKNSFQIKFHYLFTARSWRCKQYSTSEFAFFATSFKAWIRYFKTFFVSFSPLTSKHCDRYVFTFEPIIVIFLQRMKV